VGLINQQVTNMKKELMTKSTDIGEETLSLMGDINDMLDTMEVEFDSIQKNKKPSLIEKGVSSKSTTDTIDNMLEDMASEFKTIEPKVVEKESLANSNKEVDISGDYKTYISNLLEDAASEMEMVPLEPTLAETILSKDYNDYISEMISEMESVTPERVTVTPNIDEGENESPEFDHLSDQHKKMGEYLDKVTKKTESKKTEDVDTKMGEYISTLKELSEINANQTDYLEDNKEFVTFDEMKDHYRLFARNVQIQLSSLGGGGIGASDVLQMINENGGGGGENFVSSDADNSAALGSDGGIYVVDHHLQADPINPVNTYDADGILIRIDYDGVSFKTFTYNDDGQLSQLYCNRYGVIGVKTFIYSTDGNLINVVHT